MVLPETAAKRDKHDVAISLFMLPIKPWVVQIMLDSL
jgi:hypothetical protein